MTFQRARSKEAIEQRRQEILNQTSQLFLEQDYTDISLATIAKDLQISRPSLYTYFKSKEEVFLALLKIEYLACEERLRTTYTPKLSREEFCHWLTATVLASPLFVKLLSLHSSAFEEKLGYDVTYAFKKDVLPFFKTLPAIVHLQFPKASDTDLWLFVYQFNILITTFYQHGSIPEEQRHIMAELKTYGDAPLLSQEMFFSKTFYQLTSLLEK